MSCACFFFSGWLVLSSSACQTLLYQILETVFFSLQNWHHIGKTEKKGNTDKNCYRHKIPLLIYTKYAGRVIQILYIAGPNCTYQKVKFTVRQTDTPLFFGGPQQKQGGTQTGKRHRLYRLCSLLSLCIVSSGRPALSFFPFFPFSACDRSFALRAKLLECAIL